MDVPTGTDPPDKPSAYKTSKQVQAWFLGRSRDLWKKKHAELKVEFKRLQQQVADVCRSRADWRGKAEAAGREVQELRAQIAELQTRLDALSEESQKKSDRSSRPR
jgi:chromosome segregation ATPase